MNGLPERLWPEDGHRTTQPEGLGGFEPLNL